MNQANLHQKLKAEYPEDFDAMGEEEFTLLVDDGINKAKSYGINQEEDIELYLDIMFNLDYDFDTNVQYPWAKQILRNSNLTAEEKLRQLSDLALDALDEEAEGEGDEEE